MYVQERPGRYFTWDELTRTSTGLANQPDERQQRALIELCTHVLDPLRERLDRPITINSGFRSPAVNQAVGGSRTSQHLRGEAADIVISGMRPSAVLAVIRQMGLPIDQAIDERIGAKGWLHVSYGARHRRQFLVFDGKEYRQAV